MNIAALVITWSLLAQVTDRYEPRITPSKRAPAARIEREPLGEEPATEPESPSLDAGSRPRDDEFESPSRRYRDEEPSTEMSDAEPRRKIRPPDLLAEALRSPQEAALVGKATPLVTALSHTNDRAQQLKIAQAYWRLSTAQAGYHWARDARDKLRNYTEQHTNVPEILAARSAARAEVLDAELAVAQAQHELADLLGIQKEAQLPLASDRPHVGGYNTDFEQIFSGRTPPPRIRLIHRTLPLRRKSIDMHGEAIVATGDALAAVGEEFGTNQAVLSMLMNCLDQFRRERRAFLASVRDYNQEIAEYLLAVVPANATAQTLASALILKTERGAAPAKEKSGARPSSDDPENEAARRETRRQISAAATQELTVLFQPDDASSGTEEQGEYQGLMNFKPPARVQKLSGLLHWDRSVPQDSGQSITLPNCLRNVPPGARLAVISAYWRARERAAIYQAAGDKVEQLNALASLAISLRRQTGIIDTAVRLQASRRAANAALVDAHLELIKAGFDLTQAAGRRIDENWLLASTPPQAGSYDVGSQTARKQLHWARMIQMSHDKLQERADTVIRADDLRAHLTNEARPTHETGTEASATSAPLDQAILAVARQNEETQAFLRDLTGYNIAIANFAVAISPTGISSDELVKLLVIPRATRNDT